MKDCNSCGKCCTKYGGAGLSASATDLAIWEVDRPDIFRYVHEAAIWNDPLTQVPLDHCPWLRKVPGQGSYHCAIYYDRPEDCRLYPALVTEMVADDCEMLEPNDLLNLELAQAVLDSKFR